MAEAQLHSEDQDEEREAPLVQSIEVLSLRDAPLIGVMFLETNEGLKPFIVNEEVADALAKRLEMFLRGDAKTWKEATKGDRRAAKNKEADRGR